MAFRAIYTARVGFITFDSSDSASSAAGLRALKFRVAGFLAIFEVACFRMAPALNRVSGQFTGSGSGFTVSAVDIRVEDGDQRVDVECILG